MDDQTIKTSQRVTRSCVECGRRKIKCDKKIPCQPCRRRNVAHECRRPIVRVKGQLTVYSETPDYDSDADTRLMQDRLDALARERSALQAKIAELETALALSNPSAHSNVDATDAGDEGFFPTSLDDIVPAFERLDLNIKHDPTQDAGLSSEKEIADRLYAPAADPIFLLLPSRQASYVLVHFSLQTLGWLHCAVNADEFLNEHEEFWNKAHLGSNVDKGSRLWLAVYLALLATGILYMDLEHLPSCVELPQLGPNIDDPIQAAVHLSRLWYETSLKEIEAHGFSGVASLPVVQTLSILTLCHSNFGERQREWLMTGFMANMAKFLDMHRLGSETSCSEYILQQPEWQNPEQRELGRRLWWTCVVRDWLGGWDRPSSISPASFSCQFSVDSNTKDNLMPTIPPITSAPSPSTAVMGPPSPTHYLMAMSRLAYIFYIYIKVNTHHSPSKLAKVIEEIRIVRQNLPLHLSDKFPANLDDEQWETENPWVPMQRYLLTHSTYFMELSIARVLAVGNLGDKTRRFRQLALDAAYRILKSYARSVPRTYKLVWVVSASTVSAAIYIAIDMLTNRHDQKHSQTDIIETLTSTSIELERYAEIASHAAHGLKTIQNLLHIIHRQEESGSQKPISVHEVLRQMSPTDSAVYSPLPDELLQQSGDHLFRHVAQTEMINVDEINAMLAGTETEFPNNLDTWNESWMGF